MAKVSFVVAMYNVAPYIEQCVRSLYGQTLEDIEIVLVDDCSPDDCTEIALRVLDEYPQRKSQVKVVRQEENMGICKVRRKGCAKAEGEYIINVDGDDWVERNMAEVMYAKAIETDADMVLCGFLWHRREGDFYHTPVPQDALVDTETIRDATLNRRGWPNVWCRMTRRVLFEREEMVWPVANHSEDTVITLAVTSMAQSITYVPDVLYHYRDNPTSVTNMNDPESLCRKVSYFIRNNEVIERFYERMGISEKYQHGIMVNRVFAKNEALLMSGRIKRRKLWRDTYPELNKVLFIGNKYYRSTYREKVWVVALLLGLFPKYKRVLLSKRLRPAAIWRTGLRNSY